MLELVTIGMFAGIILLHIGVRKLMFYAYETQAPETARKIMIGAAVIIISIIISIVYLLKLYYGN
ncbi:hypothetical protein [Priestia megaterium]|uniref:hypothetical protein n=1 Tax=Priestia megaterium TaxID=1404 RepID=UPI002E21B498|nr:hypothetical protein [Priestia megaterium]